MNRHIADKASPKAEGARVRRFVELQRREGIHPAIKTLSQRTAPRSTAKMKEFLRIERDRTA